MWPTEGSRTELHETIWESSSHRRTSTETSWVAVEVESFIKNPAPMVTVGKCQQESSHCNQIKKFKLTRPQAWMMDEEQSIP